MEEVMTPLRYYLFYLFAWKH